MLQFRVWRCLVRRSRKSLLTALLFMLLAVWLAAASSYAQKAATGFLDRTITVAESQRMAAALKALGGEVHDTEYPGVGHNSWDKAYAETEMLTWLFSKSLSGATLK